MLFGNSINERSSPEHIGEVGGGMGCWFHFAPGSGVWLHTGATWVAQSKQLLVGGSPPAYRSNESILDRWLAQLPDAERVQRRLGVPAALVNRLHDKPHHAVVRCSRNHSTPLDFDSCCAAVVCTPQLQFAAAYFAQEPFRGRGGKDVFPAVAPAVGVDTVQILNSKWGAEFVLMTAECMDQPDGARPTACVQRQMLRTGWPGAWANCTCDDRISMINCQEQNYAHADALSVLLT